MQASVVTHKIIFDIDYILACPDVKSVEEVAFFKKEAVVITALKTHYIFPGVIELLKLLAARDDVKIGFLDADNKIALFVKKLFKLALGDEPYKKFKARIFYKKEVAELDDQTLVVLCREKKAPAKNLLFVPPTSSYSLKRKIKELDHSLNRIYILTSILVQVLDQAARQPLLEALDRVQKYKKGALKSYKNSLYHLGIKLLRNVNPKLEFLSQAKIDACFQEVLSETAKAECERLLYNRFAPRKILLDIDEVLSCHDVWQIEQIPIFDAFGMIIHAVRAHYVFPGVKELMQAAYDTDLEVGFYSFGGMDRNIPYVKELLRQSLKEPPDPLIYNKKATFPDELKKAEFIKYGKHNVDYHKDMREVVKTGEQIDNVIIADDELECIAPGQLPNLLRMPWTDASRISQVSGFIEHLSFRVAREVDADLQDQLVSGLVIVVYVDNERVEIQFIDKDTYQLKKVLITNQEWINCINAEKYYCKGPYTHQMRAFIASLNGKTTQICRQLNAIYYLAGLLFSIIEESNKTGQTLSKTLFKRQFRKIEKGKYQNITHLLFQQDYYYHYGLKILRKYNSSLEFMTCERLEKLKAEKITPEMRERFEKHLNYGK